MPTLIHNCGAECGIVALGVTPPAGGVRHWTAINGAVTVETDIVHAPGIRCYKFTSAAGASLYLSYTLAANVIVGRAYVYFDSLPDADCNIIRGLIGVDPGITFKSSDSSLYTSTGASLAASGIAVTTGQWYRLDFRFDTSTNTFTSDLQVDGVAAAQKTVASTAGNMTSVRFGGNIFGTSANYTHRFDTMAVSVTVGDYPIGAGAGVGLYPNADGTHSFNAAGEFEDDALNDFTSSSTDIWTSVDEPLDTTIGNYVRATGPESGEYIELQFDDLPETPDAINGVHATLCAHSAGTGANKQSARLSADSFSNFDEMAADLDYSNTTIGYHSKQYAAQPGSGSAWTESAVNAMRLRWGSSWGTVDISAVPYIDGFVLEVDYVPAGAIDAAAVDGAEASDASVGRVEQHPTAVDGAEGSDAASVHATGTVSAADHGVVSDAASAVVIPAGPVLGPAADGSIASDAALANRTVRATASDGALASDAIQGTLSFGLSGEVAVAADVATGQLTHRPPATDGAEASDAASAVVIPFSDAPVADEGAVAADAAVARVIHRVGAVDQGQVGDSPVGHLILHPLALEIALSADTASGGLRWVVVAVDAARASDQAYEHPPRPPTVTRYTVRQGLHQRTIIRRGT